MALGPPTGVLQVSIECSVWYEPDPVFNNRPGATATVYRYLRLNGEHLISDTYK